MAEQRAYHALSRLPARGEGFLSAGRPADVARSPLCAGQGNRNAVRRCSGVRRQPRPDQGNDYILRAWRKVLRRPLGRSPSVRQNRRVASSAATTVWNSRVIPPHRSAATARRAPCFRGRAVPIPPPSQPCCESTLPGVAITHPKGAKPSPPRSHRPRGGEAMRDSQMAANRRVSATPQPQEEIRQLTRIVVVDRGPRIHAVSHLVTNAECVRQPLFGLRRRGIRQFHKGRTSGRPTASERSWRSVVCANTALKKTQP